MNPQPLLHPQWDAALIRLGERAMDGAIDLTLAAIILIGGIWFSGWIAGLVRRAVQRTKRIDNTLGAFAASLVRYGLIALVVIAVLDRFGVETTQIVAVLGAATLAIGLALQGTLSNVAAGVMLVVFRPYSIGDFVEVANRKGVVRDINLFTTELATPENIKIVLPNSQCWGAPISNFTFHDTRMTTIEIGVAFDADLDRAMAVMKECALGEARVLKEPGPNVGVGRLSDFSVLLQLNYWCATRDAIASKADLIKAIKRALDAANISIPYPTSVSIHQDANANAP